MKPEVERPRRSGLFIALAAWAIAGVLGTGIGFATGVLAPDSLREAAQGVRTAIFRAPSPPPVATQDPGAPAILRDVRVYPAGTPVPPALASFMSFDVVRLCDRRPSDCAIVFSDLTGDGAAEATLIELDCTRYEQPQRCRIRAMPYQQIGEDWRNAAVAEAPWAAEGADIRDMPALLTAMGVEARGGGR